MPTEKGKSPKAAKEAAIALPETTPEQIDALARGILVSDFTIAEDVLLMRAQQGQGLTIRDLPKTYAAMKKAQPKVFLHECKADVFRERLLQMPEEKQRTRLLDMELQRMLAVEAEAKADVVEVSAASFPPLLLQLSSTTAPPFRAHKRNLEQVMCTARCLLHAPRPQPQPAALNLSSGLRGAGAACPAAARPRQRRYAHTGTHVAARPPTGTHAGTPLVVIDDMNPKYKDLNEHACLDAATLSKLAAFSISPKCVLDAVDLQSQVHSRWARWRVLGGALWLTGI